jgi:hypothetical protein
LGCQYWRASGHAPQRGLYSSAIAIRAVFLDDILELNVDMTLWCCSGITVRMKLTWWMKRKGGKERRRKEEEEEEEKKGKEAERETMLFFFTRWGMVGGWSNCNWDLAGEGPSARQLPIGC